METPTTTTAFYEDNRSPIPMVSFMTKTGDWEAFEYISLERAQINRHGDRITLHFGPAKVTLFLTKDETKKASRHNLYRALISHSAISVPTENELIKSTDVELTENERIAELEETDI